MDEKVAKMNQLLTTGQEALQQEKKTVEMLRQQIVSQTPTKVSFWIYFEFYLKSVNHIIFMFRMFFNKFEPFLLDIEVSQIHNFVE